MKRILGFAFKRYLVSTFALLTFLANPVASQDRATAAKQASSQSENLPADVPIQFLIDSAASDFHTHRPPDPAEFRHVRVGHQTAPNGAKQYMLCGEFLPAAKEGKRQWMSFVTIKTSGYEQYLGDQGANFCKQYKVTWDSKKDLSATLKSKLDSLRSEAK